MRSPLRLILGGTVVAALFALGARALGNGSAFTEAQTHAVFGGLTLGYLYYIAATLSIFFAFQVKGKTFALVTVGGLILRTTFLLALVAIGLVVLNLNAKYFILSFL
ncbi:MAG: hypothetical protein GF419_05160, partial [Ignavibacteriales bacterium]|nr:hypothetical protein [Ignavibacteriales bacterium]